MAIRSRSLLSGSTPRRPGTFSKSVQAKYVADPRLATAQAILAAGGDQSPIYHPAAGWGRLLAGAIGGYKQGKLRKEYEGQDARYQQTLADIVSGKLPRDQAAGALSGVDPDAALALKAQDWEAQDAAAKAAAANQEWMNRFGMQEVGKDRRANIMAGRQAETQERLDARQQAAFQNQADLLSARLKAEREADAAKAAAPKPLDVGALKLQDEGMGAVGAIEQSNQMIDKTLQKIEGGQIDLGPIATRVQGAMNALGMSSEKSRNLADLQANIESFRNSILLLHKGVQTEGDAQRALNQIVANLSDEKVVKQRLEELKTLNEQAASLKKSSVDTVRQNYNQPPMYGAGGAAAPAPAANPPKTINFSDW